MNDNKRSAKRKWKNALIAAALTASMILALPGWSVDPAEATETVTTTKTYEEGKTSTLTVKRAGTNPGKQGNITVDVYKVANAVKVPNYDAYSLTMVDQLWNICTDVQKSEIETYLETAQAPSLTVDTTSGNNGLGDYLYNAAYRDLAQAVAKRVLASVDGTVSGNDIAGKRLLRDSKTISGDGRAEFTGLEPGMYLVIAHGQGLSRSRYYEEKDGQIVTKAYNDGYNYTYLPELISLPMRITNTDNPNAPQGGFSTAQSAGDWRYAVTAELKAEMETQLDDVTITKKITGVPTDMRLPGRDSFVYRIEAILEGNVVYRNVVAIGYDYNNNLPNTVTLKGVIPKGATVTVTEIYDGAAFELSPTVEKTQQATLDGREYSVEFTNNYTGNGIGGGAIENRFTKNNNNGYGVDQVYNDNLGGTVSNGNSDVTGNNPTVTDNNLGGE